jgi:hypothetical protein
MWLLLLLLLLLHLLLLLVRVHPIRRIRPHHDPLHTLLHLPRVVLLVLRHRLRKLVVLHRLANAIDVLHLGHGARVHLCLHSHARWEAAHGW